MKESFVKWLNAKDLMYFVRAKWWKYLGALLMFYAIFIGLLMPLGPGIVAVDKNVVVIGGTNTLTVDCYNTHFSDTDTSLQAFLRINQEDFICASKVTVLAEDQIEAVFAIPAMPKVSDNDTVDLVINNDKDGTFSLRDVITTKIADEAGEGKLCEPVVNNNEAEVTHFPYREILYESIRNLFYHVPIWFGMVLLLLFSFMLSIGYLYNGKSYYDLAAHSLVVVGVLYGFLGLATGMMWATYTWGLPWPNDPRLNGAAIAVMVYIAYLILRGSIKDEIRRAKICATYGVFAFVIYIVFIFVLPRLTDSLHPGVGGNPAFSNYDLDNTMRMVFYPAVLGMTFIGFWMAGILLRIKLVEEKKQQVL